MAKVTLHPHARQRIRERGTNASEVILTVNTGRRSTAKFNRTLFSKNFPFERTWNGIAYRNK
jgi:hypothetical protein